MFTIQGYLDREGFLFLTSRKKELIIRGNDQVDPNEVEVAVARHSDVHGVLVFGFPDLIWGERIGAAIILKDGLKRNPREFKRELRKVLLDGGLQPFKVPDEVLFVSESNLLKLDSNKSLRIALTNKLSLRFDQARGESRGLKPVNYHEASVGVKFILALAVIYAHVGSFGMDMADYSHDSGPFYGWTNSRSWYWYTPLFFLVGGFLLAAATHVPATTIRDLKSFYTLRIAGLHPMYMLSILLCTINFVARCGPSNYINEFDRVREPLDGQYFVCQATPIEWSYWPTLIVSILFYAFGLQAWPIMIPFAW